MCRKSSRGERFVARRARKGVDTSEAHSPAARPIHSATRDGEGDGRGGPIHPFRPDNYLMRITSLLPSFSLFLHHTMQFPDLQCFLQNQHPAEVCDAPIRKLPADTFLRLLIISIILCIFTFIPRHPCQWHCGVVASG